MTVELVARAVVIEDLVINVCAWRYVCNECGNVEAFNYEDDGDLEASRKGWRPNWGSDGEEHACPHCSRRRDERVRAQLNASGKRASVLGVGR